MCSVESAGPYCTSVKIIKNEVRCRDDTVPKTVDTRKHCKVGLRACNNNPQPPPYIFVFRGCGRLLHALNPTLQCFLVSTVFGTVSPLHLTSFLMIFTLFSPIFSSHRHGKRHPSLNCMRMRMWYVQRKS